MTTFYLTVQVLSTFHYLPYRYGQVCLHSGLVIGFLLLATWAWNVVCAPDVFVWFFAFTMLNVGQLLYILYQMRPIKFDEDLEKIYTSLFGPMTVSRAQFKKLVGSDGLAGSSNAGGSGSSTKTAPSGNSSCAQIVTLHTGECYAIQNLTKTDRLALLISGRVNVLNDRTFLHDIMPGEFLDSPEFESSGLNFSQGMGNSMAGEESTFKVTVCAAVPSRLVVWQRTSLEYMLVKDPHLATVMTTIISTDITHKLYAMNSKLKKDGRNLDIRLPGIAGMTLSKFWPIFRRLMTI